MHGANIKMHGANIKTSTYCLYSLNSCRPHSNQSKTFITGEYYYMVININIHVSAGQEMQRPEWDGQMVHLWDTILWTHYKNSVICDLNRSYFIHPIVYTALIIQFSNSVFNLFSKPEVTFQSAFLSIS